VCTREFYVPLLLADVNVTSLEELGACNFTPDSIPPCLVERVASLGGAAPVAAFAANASAADGSEYYYEDVEGPVAPNATSTCESPPAWLPAWPAGCLACCRACPRGWPRARRP
jgi:hypothetical protein